MYITLKHFIAVAVIFLHIVKLISEMAYNTLTFGMQVLLPGTRQAGRHATLRLYRKFFSTIRLGKNHVSLFSC